MPSAIGNAIGDIRRVTRIIQVAMRHGFGPTLSKAKLLDKLGLGEQAAAAGSDAPAPLRFRSMLEELGPTFVKFGQILSSRHDILPRDWVTELSRLQDAVSPLPFAEIAPELTRGLGKNYTDLFASVDEKPLASASIAQVHRATLKDGAQAVLKVKRPKIRENIRADMEILRYLAIALEAVVEEAGIYNPEGIVAEFEKTLNLEMDFRVEARNILRFAENFAGSSSLVIPRLIPELCSENVICMQYIEGVKITEIGAGFDRDAIARNLLDAAFKQVYEDGFFHADPHPGNLLALPDNKVALLDFGQVGELTKLQKELLVSMSLAVALRDSESIARIIYRAARSDKRVKLSRLRMDVEDLLDRYIDMDISAVRSGTLLIELVEVASRERLRLPPEYTMLAKGSVTIEGIVRALAPNMNIGATMKPYAQRLLTDRYSADTLQEALVKLGMRLYAVMQDIPLQLDQIVGDIEEGRLNISVSGEQVEMTAKNIRRAAFSLGGAVVGAAFIIGGFICLAAGRDAAGAVGLAGGGAIAVFSLAYHVAAGIRLKKIRLTKPKREGD
jgi:ubiquinone biosynthesis protein